MVRARDSKGPMAFANPHNSYPDIKQGIKSATKVLRQYPSWNVTSHPVVLESGRLRLTKGGLGQGCWRVEDWRWQMRSTPLAPAQLPRDSWLLGLANHLCLLFFHSLKSITIFYTALLPYIRYLVWYLIDLTRSNPHRLLRAEEALLGKTFSRHHHHCASFALISISSLNDP